MKKAVPAGRQGFTLIEVIIALALSATILLAGTFVFSSAYKTYRLASKKTEIMQIEQSILGRIVKDCRSAQKIDLIEGKITINNTKYYDIKDKKVHMQDGSYSAYLTDINQVTNLNFRQLKSNLIKITVGNLTTEVAIRNE
jgi:prepilin-type N-terminal cleavage/methylation domain-containing protein